MIVFYTFGLLKRRHPSSPLFPYTTLFRSGAVPPATRRHALCATPRGAGRGRRRFRGGGRVGAARVFVVRGQLRRSEEHTSELQSLTNLVCRLLLEKKKTQDTS